MVRARLAIFPRVRPVAVPALGLHLFAICDLIPAIIAWHEFIEQHGSELGIHDLFFDRPANGVTNVPRIYDFVVEQSFEAARSLVESSPHSIKQNKSVDEGTTCPSTVRSGQ